VDGNSVDAGTNLIATGSTLYHGGNGYLSYGLPFNLTLSEANRTGDWSAISTSTKGNTTVPIFSAYTTVPTEETYTYAFFPATNPDRLAAELVGPTTSPIEINGILGIAGAERLSFVFWPGSGTSATVSLSTIGWASIGEFTVSTSDPAVFLFATRREPSGGRTLVVTFSEPTQILTTLSFSLASSKGGLACADVDWDDGCSGSGEAVVFDVDLPSDGLAGSSVFREVNLGWRS